MNFRFRSRVLKEVALGTLLLASLPSISAAAIYRCGNTYGQTPCADSIEINANDSRTEEQRRDSIAGQRMMKNLARDMERDRLKFEAANKPYAGVVGLEKVGLHQPEKVAAREKLETKRDKKDKKAVKPKTGLNTPAGEPFVAQSAGSAPEKSKKKKKKS